VIDQRDIPVVQTAGLCKTFKDFWRRPRVEAVKDLNLEIAPGEIFGLLGPNGSGKTTTIKMLLGLLHATRGRISVFGRSPSDVSVKARIGFLPEESYLYRFLVAHETLDYYGRLFRLPARIRRDRADRLLDMVGLRHEAKRPLGEYSKGMARRIGLAQALINDPEFLILDEPTSGLDPIGARQIKDLIRDLGRKGKTILLSSHVLSDVEDVCDRVTILYGGQQQAVGDIDDLLAKRDVTQIKAHDLSEDTVAQIRDLVKRLEAKDILEVSNPRERLEEFFLQIVEEAQAAKIVTSGARAGTELPEFLQQPTARTEDVVGELVTAAKLTRNVEKLAPAPLAPDDQSTRKVLTDLLRSDEQTAPAPTAAPTGPSPSPGPACEPKAGDAGVIDALIDHTERPTKADDED